MRAGAFSHKYLKTHNAGSAGFAFCICTHLPILRSVLATAKWSCTFMGLGRMKALFERQYAGCVIIGSKRWIRKSWFTNARRGPLCSPTLFHNLLDGDVIIFPKERIHVIPRRHRHAKRFAVSELAREAARAKVGLGRSSRPTIVAVRRLVPRMGLENLVEAAVKIVKARDTRYLN